MQKLSVSRRAKILQALLEGTSICSVSRMTGHAENTIDGILKHVGEACAAHHREQARGLESEQVQLDEQWSFVGCRAEHLLTAKRRHPGNVWIRTCLCADSKLIVNWRIGDRTLEDGLAFCADLGPRFTFAPQVNTDGLNIYRQAVPNGFGRCDFAQLMKFYKEVNGKLKVVKIIKAARRGNPDPREAQHVIRGASEPHHPHDEPAHDTPHERFQQEPCEQSPHDVPHLLWL